jgi:hypothetical protein
VIDFHDDGSLWLKMWDEQSIAEKIQQVWGNFSVAAHRDDECDRDDDD